MAPMYLGYTYVLCPFTIMARARSRSKQQPWRIMLPSRKLRSAGQRWSHVSLSLYAMLGDLLISLQLGEMQRQQSADTS